MARIVMFLGFTYIYVYICIATKQSKTSHTSKIQMMKTLDIFYLFNIVESPFFICVVFSCAEIHIDSVMVLLPRIFNLYNNEPSGAQKTAKTHITDWLICFNSSGDVYMIP